jgi:3-hydroxypropanoate dehydrogenase
MAQLDGAALDTLFRTARSHNAWLPKPVSDDEIRAIYDLLKWAPTSANCCPARFLFLRSQADKERLKPALGPTNRDKTMLAPVVAIIGTDLKFYDKIPKLFAHNPAAREWFAAPGKEEHARVTGFRNGTLQGAYFIIAARALGYDCGPMSGFDNAKVDAEFFPDGQVKSNFLCSFGHGDPAKIMPRNPRLTFDEACKLL